MTYRLSIGTADCHASSFLFVYFWFSSVLDVNSDPSTAVMRDYGCRRRDWSVDRRSGAHDIAVPERELLQDGLRPSRLLSDRKQRGDRLWDALHPARLWGGCEETGGGLHLAGLPGPQRGEPHLEGDHREAGVTGQSGGGSMIIMSHGQHHVILGSDSISVHHGQIFKLFDGKSCSALRDKPKLFFILACRGGEQREMSRVLSQSGLPGCRRLQFEGSSCRSRVPVNPIWSFCSFEFSWIFFPRIRRRGSWWYSSGEWREVSRGTGSLSSPTNK